MRIGLDFDNTIAGYDLVFPREAHALGLVAAEFVGGKAEIRAHLKAEGAEKEWMRLQGRVYGALMPEAEMIKGVAGFLARAKAAGAELFVVSHKTVHGHFDPDRVDMRQAARAWMKDQGLFKTIPAGNVFFADDRPAKVAKIASLNLDVFIDDLEEVYREPGFPASVRAILFTNGRPGPADLECLSHWDAITKVIFDAA